MATIDLTSGDDIYSTAATGDTINGLEGADQLTSTGSGNTLAGGDGNDTLTGSFTDLFIGGTGDDTYAVQDYEIFSDLSITEHAGEGVDTIILNYAPGIISLESLAAIENLTALFTSSATLTGNALDNTLTAADGNDTLDGGIGADTMIGGAGFDTYVVDNAGDIVIETAGTDQDAVYTNLAEYVLPENVEGLYGYAQTGQTLIGNNGSLNYIEGGSGNDTIDAKDGNNFVHGMGGNDTITGGEDVDELFGDKGNDTIKGADGIDQLDGGAGNDTLDGGAGDDRLDGGTGIDTMSGGTGDDTYLVDDSNDQITESLSEGNDTVKSAAASYTLAGNVENLVGMLNTKQTLVGNDLANHITAGIGDDWLDGGAGADVMTGGLGNDTYVVDDVNDVVVELAGQNGNQIRTSLASYILADNISSLVGTSDTGQTLTGNSLVNAILGAAGDDVINGQDHDQLFGGQGNDTLNLSGQFINSPQSPYGIMKGEDGDDHLIFSGSQKVAMDGGSGNDQLVSDAAASSSEIYMWGGEGNDQLEAGGTGAHFMWGNAGDDTYIINAVTTVTENADEGTDTIITSAQSYTLLENFENLTGAGARAQTLIGNGVANVIIAQGNGSEVFGGAGDDDITMSAPGTAHGGDGNDILRAPQATGVTLYGDAGDDQFAVEGNGNSVYGGAGLDIIGITLTGSGDTLVDGGGDADFITVSGGTNGPNISVDGGAGDDTLYLSAWYLQVHGSSGNDTIWAADEFGSTASSSIDFSDVDAGEGNDSLQGTFRWGTLACGAGDDRIEISATLETISGGDGNDWISISDVSSQVTVAGDAGDDTFVFAAPRAGAITAPPQIEFKGGAGGDTYLVDDADIKVTEVANQGTDTVKTLLANYTLVANVENLVGLGRAQVLTGNGLANSITGGAGADRIKGLAGMDRLSGAAGADHFVYATIAEGGDHITDFARGDVIDVKGANFGGLAAGALNASMFRSAAAHVARDANDHFLFDTRNGQLWYDADGNKAGAARLLLDLDNAYKLSALDIHII